MLGSFGSFGSFFSFSTLLTNIPIMIQETQKTASPAQMAVHGGGICNIEACGELTQATIQKISDSGPARNSAASEAFTHLCCHEDCSGDLTDNVRGLISERISAAMIAAANGKGMNASNMIWPIFNRLLRINALLSSLDDNPFVNLTNSQCDPPAGLAFHDRPIIPLARAGNGGTSGSAEAV
jgi:hypothetical protein